MKRATVLILALSLLALPLFAQNPMRCAALEHVRGGWTMTIECDGAGGTITMTDDGAFQGTGMFGKSSQEQLRSTYQSLIPSDDGRVEYPQLG